MTIPDDFPTFLPVSKSDVPASPTVAPLDIEHAKRVDAAQWKRDYLAAQAEMEAMRAEHEAERKRDKEHYLLAGFIIGIAVPVGLIWEFIISVITSLFGA